MALTPAISAIQTKLGHLTLPPTPSPPTSRSLAQHQQAMSVWTRKAQQSIQQIAQTLSALDTSLIPPSPSGGGTYWTQALFDAAFAAKTTDNLAQGVDNLYWTQSLFDTAFAAKTTDALPEGATNLYWTSARFSSAFSAAFPSAFSTSFTAAFPSAFSTAFPSAFSTAFTAETTDNLAQGVTNLYWTSGLFTTAFAAAFPSAFNTAFAAKTTDALPQGSTNLYFTATAAHGAFSATSPLTYNSSTGAFGIQQANTSQSGFLSATDWNTFNTGATEAAAALPATKQTKSVVLCSAYTPTATGADIAEIEMPFDTGGSSLTYNVLRLFFRVQTAGGAPAISIEKSTSSGAFSATTVGTVTLSSGANEGQVTSSLGTVASGTKLRFNALTLATATGWTVQVDIAAT